MSQNNKRKHALSIGLVLFVLGLLGILSMLTMDISLPAEVEALLLEKFTTDQLKWVMLINPTILLIIAVVVGNLVYAKVNLQLPIITNLIGIDKQTISLNPIVLYGIAGGFLAGILLVAIGEIYKPMLPEEFMELGEKVKPTLLMRFLYGGITEEILLRFGFMSLITWVLYKVFNNLSDKVYWIGLVLTAILFALAHLPIAFQSVQEPSSGLISYILLGNSIGGIIFGWLYWKKGLESAFIAHIITHVVMVSVEMITP